jgi:hypothetical protein
MTVRVASFQVESLSLSGFSLDSSSISGAFNGGTISNPLFVSNTTATTSPTTGSLRVAGGAGINQNLFIGGTLVVEDERIEIRTSGDLRFFNTANTRYVALSAPDAISENKTYILPSADGTVGQFLRTNGSGVLSWATAGGAAELTAAGLTTQVQFNDNGTFGSNTNFTFDPTSQLLSAPKITASGAVTISDNTSSTSSSTGALKVSGGAGIQGQINVGGSVNKFTGNTQSTSTLTGTVVVTGGMGVSGSMHVGSTVSAGTNPTTADHLTNKRYVDANILAFSVAFGA